MIIIRNKLFIGYEVLTAVVIINNSIFRNIILISWFSPENRGHMILRNVGWLVRPHDVLSQKTDIFKKFFSFHILFKTLEPATTINCTLSEKIYWHMSRHGMAGYPSVLFGPDDLWAVYPLRWLYCYISTLLPKRYIQFEKKTWSNLRRDNE
jgi:hypothetical protein